MKPTPKKPLLALLSKVSRARIGTKWRERAINAAADRLQLFIRRPSDDWGVWDMDDDWDKVWDMERVEHIRSAPMRRILGACRPCSRDHALLDTLTSCLYRQRNEMWAMEERSRRQCRLAAKADMADEAMQQFMNEALADVEGWAE